ncbi:VC0807 family protein [Nonomuraea sp. NPDC049400]|uniref:VC0807 family protein n=1 Tax=Nonomuraea sp. NPDC049400 TaxID=3364352 RepID=UPI0037905C9E
MDRRALLMGLLWDVGLPAIVFYVCRALGFDVLLALAVGGLAALIRVGFIAVVRHRLDGLAALVGVTFALLLAVSLLTGDPRILLARESILSGAAGLLLVGSCAIGRPVLYTLLRRLNAGKDEMLAQLDERWRTQPTFRRHFVLLSTVIGGVLLTESIVRLLLIYLLPIDVMAALSPTLQIGTIALLICWVLWYRGRGQRAVAADRLTPRADSERPRAR